MRNPRNINNNLVTKNNLTIKSEKKNIFQRYMSNRSSVEELSITSEMFRPKRATPKIAHVIT